MTVTDPRYMTVTEVAKLLKVSKMTVYRMVRSGEIRSVAIGQRNFRIPEAALRPYLPDAE